MKKDRIIFHKNFTRDTTLLLQQLWPVTMEEGIKEFGIVNKYTPTIIDYINNGTCEIWENDQAVSFIQKQFIKYCQKEPLKALSFLESYEGKVKGMEPVWRRGVLSSLLELKKYVAHVKENMVGDFFILYIADEEKIKGEVKKLAFKLRDGDHYFSSSNQVFVNTLKKLFPRYKNYVNVIRLEDLDNMPTLSELKRRYKNYICVAYNYASSQTLSDYAKRHRNYIFAKEKAQVYPGIVKGTAANLGRVTGRVKLVFTTNDLSKVKTGDILISPMTTVNFMSAIKKAAAIVTDEGGIICHAAIVSRELKKPCLIATKIATKVFKDNDLVEVDVFRKIVRKIS